VDDLRLALLALCGVLTGCTRTPFADGLPSSLDCSGCHGEGGDPTPPPAVNGATGTDSIGVGAHQVHLHGSSLAGPVACSECHLLPSQANGTDHPDPLGRPARVTFGLVAAQAGAHPVWHRTTRTCSGTYCHGATESDSSERADPLWTRVDGSQLHCDSCHGYPPPAPHPADATCEACHDAVVGAGGVITNPVLHVNGTVEFTR
jgi:predicted CxxxxCH...CXXCH cytochrome family protein